MPLRDIAPTGAPCWIDLFTSDPDAAQSFYGQLFGWKAETAGEEYGGYINFSKDGVAVAGGMRNDGSSGMPDAWSVYLATDDAQKLTEAVTSRGGTVVAPPMAVADLGTMLVLGAPDGATVGAWQPGSFTGLGVLGEPGTPAWFELHTRDHAAAVAFYREAFGWEVEVTGDTDEFRYVVLASGGSQYAGIMDATAFLPEGTPAQWWVYLGAADVDATVAKAVELGGTVLQAAEDTPYGRLAALADPNGAGFRVVSTR
jgi:predicted enzyme related to lactoylglutathione lyase